MELKVQESHTETFTKNIALSSLQLNGEFTLRKQKVWHILVYCIREIFFLRSRFDESNSHQITETYVESIHESFEIDADLVMESMGYKRNEGFYSYRQVLNIFIALSKEIVGVDALGLSNEQDDWTGFASFIGQCKLQNGKFVIWLPPLMVYYIVNPSRSFRAPVNWNAFNNKFSPLVYDACLFFHQSAPLESGYRYTDWIPVSEFRRITGTTSATYDDFNKLRRRVLQKAIDNINSAEELELFLDLEAESFDTNNTVGRNRISHIRFKISEKLSATSRRNSVLQNITLSTISTELEALGIASNAIQHVIDEASHPDYPDLLYLKWCIKKGHQLKQLNYRGLDTDDVSITESQKRTFNFGGYFRKHIVRNQKENWFTVDMLVKHFIDQSVMINHGQSREKAIDQVKRDCKRLIAENFLNSLSDVGFAHLRDKFIRFVSQSNPALSTGLESPVLMDLVHEDDFRFMLFLEFKSHSLEKPFSPEAYSSALSALLNG